MQSQGITPSNVASGQDPLAQLRDIHVPNEVSVWPLDWGWWCLAIAVIIVVAWTVKAICAHIRFNKPRKQALKLLSEISQSQDNWPLALNTLLKRTALSYFPNDNVAQLHGDAWQTFLHSTMKKDNSKITQGISLLLENSYRQTPRDADFELCQQSVRTWITNATFSKSKPSGNVHTKEVNHA